MGTSLFEYALRPSIIQQLSAGPRVGYFSVGLGFGRNRLRCFFHGLVGQAGERVNRPLFGCRSQWKAVAGQLGGELDRCCNRE